MGKLHDLLKSDKATNEEILAEIVAFGKALHSIKDIGGRSIFFIEKWQNKESEYDSHAENTENPLHLIIKRLQYKPESVALIAPLINLAGELRDVVNSTANMHLPDALYGPPNSQKVYRGHERRLNFMEIAIETLPEKEALEVLSIALKSPHAIGLINYVDPQARTEHIKGGLLSFALKKKYSRIIESLIQHPHFDVNKQKPLYWAIESGFEEGFDQLLKVRPPARIDVNQLDEDKLTPLMRAIEKNNIKFALKLIQDNRVDLNKQDPESGKTALHRALDKVPINLELVTALLDKGANLEKIDSQNRKVYDMLLSYPDTEKILKDRESIKKGQAFLSVEKEFGDRLGIISRVRMDDRLFAHINKGYKIKGTKLEGNVYSNTARYMEQALKLILKNKLIKFKDEKEKKEFELLAGQLEQFCEFEKIIRSNADIGRKALLEQQQRHKNLKTPSSLQEEADRKLMNEMLDKTASEIGKTIQSDLDTLGYAFMPGGWTKFSDTGHAMAYEFSKGEKGDIIFTVYNSGAGNQYHLTQEEERRKKTSPILCFKLDKSVRHLLSSKIKDLLKPNMLPYWDKGKEGSFDDGKTYEQIFKSFSGEGITLLPLPKDTQFIPGQRGGTCSWSSLETVLKRKLSPDQYRRTNIQMKFQSLLEYLNTHASKEELASFEVQQLLKDAISNLNRLILQRVKKGDNIKDYENIITFCNNVKHTLSEAEKATVSTPPTPSIHELTAFTSDRLFQVEAGGLKSKASTLSSKEEKEKKEVAEGRYDYPLSYKFTDPETDLINMLNIIKEGTYNNNVNSRTYIEKSLEAFFLKIPLGNSKNAKAYWKQLKPERAVDCFYFLMELQRSYGSNMDPNARLTSRRLVCAYSLFGIQNQIINEYFPHQAIRNIIDNSVEFSSVSERKEFMLKTPELAARIEEVEKTVVEQRERSKNLLSLEALAKTHAIQTEEYVNLAKEELKGINELREKRGEKPYEIDNMDHMGLFIALQKHPELIKNKKFKQDVNLFFAQMVSQKLNEMLWRGDYNGFQIPMGFSRDTIIDVYIQTYHREPRQVGPLKKPRKFIYYAQDLTEIPKYKKMGDLIAEKSKITTKERFQTEYASLSSNFIQCEQFGEETLSDRIAHHRSLLQASKQVVTTVERFLSEIDKLADLDYQNLLTLSLVGKDRLKNELENNPAVAEHLLKLINHGIDYYMQDKEITGPAYYFLKLNGILLENLEALPKDHPGRAWIAKAVEIDKKNEILINDNNPNERKFESEKEMNRAIIIQKHLYNNLLHRAERDCIRNEVTKDTYKNYLKAVFYNRKYPISPIDPNLKFDPAFQEIQDNVLYHITPSLVKYLNTLTDDQKFEFILECVPPESRKKLEDIKKQALKFLVKFPNMIFTLPPEGPESLPGFATLNLIEGVFQTQAGFVNTLLPAWVHEHPQYKKLFKTNIASGSVRTDGNEAEFFDQAGHLYRIHNQRSQIWDDLTEQWKHKAGSLSKRVMIDGVEHWCEFKEFDENLNILPPFLNDKSYQAWISRDTVGTRGAETIVYSDIDTARNAYVLKDGKITSFDGYEQVNVYSHHKDSDVSTPFDFLKRFEFPGFINVLKKTEKNKDPTCSDLIINLLRYNINFELKDQTKLVWSQDERYQLDLRTQADIIPGFTDVLRLTPTADRDQRDLVLIPWLPFVATDEAHAFALDKKGLYVSNALAETGACKGNRMVQAIQKLNERSDTAMNSFMPDQWNLKNSSRFIKCYQNKKGELEPEETQDYLYLAYLYMGNNQPEKAFQMLSEFKRRGGFSGTEYEAKTVYWILNSIPFQLTNEEFRKTEPKMASHQKSAEIATPELTAFRAQVLGMVIPFLDSQQSFKYTNTELQQANREVAKQEEASLKDFFNRKNLNLTTKKVLTDYHSIETHIPVAMKLNASASVSLYMRNPIESYSPEMQDRWRHLFFHKMRVDQRALYSQESDYPYQSSPRYKEVISMESVSLRYPYPLVYREDIEQLLLGEGTAERVESCADLTSDIHPRTFLASFSNFFDSALGRGKPPPDVKTVSENRHMIISFAKQKIQGHFQNLALKSVDRHKNRFTAADLQKEIVKFLNPPDTGYLPNRQVNDNETAVLYGSLLLYQAAQFPELFKDEDFISLNYFKKRTVTRGFKKAFDTLHCTLDFEIPCYKPKEIREPSKLLDKWVTPESALPAHLSVDPTITQKSRSLETTLVKSEFPSQIEVKVAAETQKEVFEGVKLIDYQTGEEQNLKDKAIHTVFLNLVSKGDKLKTLSEQLKTARLDSFSHKARLEQALIQFANGFSPERVDKLSAEASKLGQTSKSLKIEDILKLYLKGDRNYYHHETHLSEKDIPKLYQLTTEYLLEATQFQHYDRADKAVEELKVEKPGSDAFYKSSDKLCDILYAKRAYDYLVEPNLLVFEYYADIKIREAQKGILKTLIGEQSKGSQAGFPSAAMQLIMGGGKSKVLIPIAAFQKATGNNLAIVLVPPALYETNFRDLFATSKTYFNQEAIRFSFSRETNCEIGNLLLLEELLKSTITNKNYLITTNTDVEALELKYLELMEKSNTVPVDPNVINTLERMLGLFKYKGDALIDEVDTILDVRKELNFTVSSEVKLNPTVASQLLTLYDDLQEAQITVEGKSYRVKDIIEGTLPTLSDDRWNKLFKEEVAPKSLDHLLNNPNNPMRHIADKYHLDSKMLMEYFQSNTEDIPKDITDHDLDIDRLSKTIGRTPSVLRNFLEKSNKELSENEQMLIKSAFQQLEKREKLDFQKLSAAEKQSYDKLNIRKLSPADQKIYDRLKELKKLKDSDPNKKAPPQFTAAERELIGLYKGQFTNLLKSTLNKVANVNYGLTKQKDRAEEEREIAIPYSGNGAPSEKSKFQSPLETANYTIQYNLIHGVSMAMIKKLIKQFRVNAIKERDQLSGASTSISDTPSGQAFKAMTGLEKSLYQLNEEDEESLTLIHQKIFKRPEVIQYCLRNYIINNVKHSNKVLRHNSQNHTSMYRSVQGFSGTIQSSFVFDERMKFEEKVALGTDGKTLHHLISKKTTVLTPPESTAVERLNACLSRDPNMRAIIDVGSHFKGIENIAIARKVAQFYRKTKASSPSPLKYVLFFNPANELSAINIEKPRAPPIVIGKTDPMTIKERLQCSSEEYFTYYDERHTTGTDIQQMPNAKALVTFSAQTLMKDFLQAVMRMRDLAGTHQVDVVVPPEVTQAYPDIKEWNISTVLSLAQKNQLNRIKDDNFRAAVHKIKNVVRDHLITTIKSSSLTATADPLNLKRSWYNIFSEFLCSTESDSLFEQFRDVEKEHRTEDILKELMNQSLKAWKKCFELGLQRPLNPGEIQVQQWLKQQMEEVIRHALPVCHKKMKAINEHQGAEVQSEASSERTTEVAVAAQQEVSQAVQLQNQTNSFMPGANPIDEPSLFKFLPFEPLLKQQEDKSMIPNFKFSAESLNVDSEILISEAFAKTITEKPLSLFDAYAKPVYPILFRQTPVIEPGKPTRFITKAIIISAEEAEAYRSSKGIKYEEAFGIDTPETRSWIITPKEIPFFGNPPETLGPDYHILLEMIRFYNGDTDILLNNRDKLVWLNDSERDKKLEFYEKIILGCHPDKQRAFPILKALLLKKQPTLKPSLAQTSTEKPKAGQAVAGPGIAPASPIPSALAVPPVPPVSKVSAPPLDVKSRGESSSTASATPSPTPFTPGFSIKEGAVTKNGKFEERFTTPSKEDLMKVQRGLMNIKTDHELFNILANAIPAKKIRQQLPQLTPKLMTDDQLSEKIIYHLKNLMSKEFQKELKDIPDNIHTFMKWFSEPNVHEKLSSDVYRDLLAVTLSDHKPQIGPGG